MFLRVTHTFKNYVAFFRKSLTSQQIILHTLKYILLFPSWSVKRNRKCKQIIFNISNWPTGSLEYQKSSTYGSRLTSSKKCRHRPAGRNSCREPIRLIYPFLLISSRLNITKKEKLKIKMIKFLIIRVLDERGLQK